MNRKKTGSFGREDDDDSFFPKKILILTIETLIERNSLS